MRKLFTSFSILIIFIHAHAQNFNLQLRSEVSFPYICSSIWGYAQDGNEYALVGNFNGVSIVDVTDPDNPVDLFDVATENSEWREIKTYGHYAYASTEDEYGGHLGMLIIDLSQLPTSYSQYYFTYTDAQNHTQDNGHTLWIDEQGRLFIFGGNYGNGGMGGYTCFDLTADPLNPTFLGKYENNYIHDGMVRGDTLWASEIYSGQLEVLNVANPASAVSMAVWNTTSNFTHNSWPTSDDHYLFTTDEVDNSYLTSYDVSDLSNVTELDKAQSNPGSNVIIHNVHLYNDQFATVAYYKDGVVLFDVSHPDNMIEVGSYDTDPGESGGNYGGTWGVYPYLPSGNIIASDYTDAGAVGGKLTVLTPNYVSACWLEGLITDSITGIPINNASVQVLTTTNSDLSDLSGNYKTGNGVQGTYQVQYSKTGYGTKTFSITLDSGVVTTKDVQLVPLTAFSYTGQVLDAATSTPISGANVLFDGGINGTISTTTDASGNFSLASIYNTSYNVYAGKWSYKTKGMMNVGLNENSSPMVIYLNQGYYDDFLFNFNWQSIGGNSSTGKWIRDVPIGTSDVDGVYNPFFDVDNDYGTECFMTGNGGGDPGTSDVDATVVTLTSPVFDISEYGEPYISFYAWWVDSGPFGAPDDTMHITLSNGSTTVPLLNLINNNSDANWDFHSFKVSDYITPSNNMTMKLSTVDYEGNANWIEGGLDVFQVVDSLATGIASSSNPDLNIINSYPNPFSDESIIDFNFKQPDFRNASISIYNAVGQLIHAYTLRTPEGSFYWGNDLPSGTYFITIAVNDVMQKMIPVLKNK